MRTRWWGVGLVLLTLLALVGCDPERELEKLMGAIAQAFWEMGYDRTEDPLLTELTETTGRRIAEVSPRKDMPVKFRLLNTSEVNAVALPNGRIYVFRGMLEATDTEDELAAVLAHEVGHVVGRHSLKQFRLAWGIGLLADLLNLNKRGETVQALAGVASTLYQLGYSRQHERDADTYAWRLALLAGYDPVGSVALFDKFVAREGRPSRLLSYLSTHPPSTERLERAKRAVANMGAVYPDLPAFAAHTFVAAGYAQRGLYRHAVHHYEAALKEQPRHVPALLGMAQAKEALGEWEDAARWYEGVLSVEPQNATAQQGLERVRQHLSNTPQTSLDSEPVAPPLWLLRALDEWAFLQRQWQPAWRTAVTATNSAVTQAKTLWSQMQTLPAQLGTLTIRLGKGSTLTYRYDQRDRKESANLSSGLAYQETRRMEELREQLETLAEDVARTLATFQVATAELESLLEDAQRATALWQRALQDWKELTAKGVAPSETFAHFSDESSRLLFRIAASVERESATVRDMEERLTRTVTALAESANLLQRSRHFSWAAESRIQLVRSALQVADADLRAFLSRIREKRSQVDKALLSAYHTRLAALEAKTPPAVAQKIVAYHLRVTEEQVQQVRKGTPDIGAAAIVLAFAKGRKSEPSRLMTDLDFKGDWLTPLVTPRAPSGVRVALRWLTTAWEREWDEARETKDPLETEKESRAGEWE